MKELNKIVSCERDSSFTFTKVVLYGCISSYCSGILLTIFIEKRENSQVWRFHNTVKIVSDLGVKGYFRTKEKI